MLSGPITMTGTFAQQPEDKIPGWVKNNAKWWAEGAIDESSFVQGIQYLIKEDIMDIPTTTQGSSSGSNAVPGWVKNNAEWWAEGAIDESSFVQGIQYLIGEGIMQVSSTKVTLETTPEKNKEKKDPKEQKEKKEKDPKEQKEKKEKDPKDKKEKKEKDSKEMKEKKEKAKKYIHLKISKSSENLVDKVQKEGKVRVIVELNTDFDPKLPKEKKMKQKADIKAAQKSLMDTLSSDGISSLHNFEETPQIAMTVNGDSLDELISSPMVKSIMEDRLNIQHLDLSIPIVRADILFDVGLDGTGQIVVVIDTGVDKSHNFFDAGRVVSEACFTSIPTEAQASSYSLCQNDLVQDLTVGSGIPCSIDIDSVDTIIDDCTHGTHVAGIAAGADTGFEVSGVAKGVDIISINVFTIFEGDGTGRFQFCPFGTVANPTYCLGAFESDLIAALEHVLFLYNNGFPNISSVNLSLGGTEYDYECDVVPFVTSTNANLLKMPIDNLRNVGIATIVSAGNIGGATEIMTTPACISSAISVSSTDDDDDFPFLAAQASFLDFLAPGGNSGRDSDFNLVFTPDSGINSSVHPGNGFGIKTGTSMAAPHVSGAWAILSAANATASFDDIFSALKDTGIPLPLRNTAHGIKPLIQLDRALATIITDLCFKDISVFKNIIFGTNGPDTIDGTSDADLIIGFDGDDRIRGNDGNDCLIGGNGVDRLSGGDGDDYLQGNDGADHLTGRAGVDTLFGGDGDDILSGGEDNDELNGGDDNDILYGRTGDDSLDGGAGTDVCKGGGEAGDSIDEDTCEYPI